MPTKPDLTDQIAQRFLERRGKKFDPSTLDAVPTASTTPSPTPEKPPADGMDLTDQVAAAFLARRGQVFEPSTRAKMQPVAPPAPSASTSAPPNELDEYEQVVDLIARAQRRATKDLTDAVADRFVEMRRGAR